MSDSDMLQELADRVNALAGELRSHINPQLKDVQDALASLMKPVAPVKTTLTLAPAFSNLNLPGGWAMINENVANVINPEGSTFLVGSMAVSLPQGAIVQRLGVLADVVTDTQTLIEGLIRKIEETPILFVALTAHNFKTKQQENLAIVNLRKGDTGGETLISTANPVDNASNVHVLDCTLEIHGVDPSWIPEGLIKLFAFQIDYIPSTLVVLP